MPQIELRKVTTTDLLQSVKSEDAYAVLLMLESDMMLSHNDRLFSLSKGCTVVISPGEAVIFTYGTFSKFIMIRFCLPEERNTQINRALLQQVFKRGPSMTRLPIVEIESMLPLTNMVGEQTMGIQSSLIRSYLYNRLFALLFLIYSQGENELEAMISTLSNAQLSEKVNRYLSCHYHEPFSLQKLENHLHLNGSYICRQYRDQTGKRLTQELAKIRIKTACSILLNTWSAPSLCTNQ